MNQEFIYKGVWFLPNNPEERIAGDFNFSPNSGGTLTLLGWFGEFEDNSPYEIILGETTNGKIVTCYRCSLIGKTFSSSGVQTSTTDVRYLFDGWQFSSSSELNFSGIHFRFEDLDRWVGVFGFEHIRSKRNEGSFMINIQYTQPQNLTYELFDGVEIEFVFGTTYPLFKSTSEAKISQTCFIEIKRGDGVSKFEELVSWLGTFSRFLTVAYFEQPPLLQPGVTLSHNPRSNEIAETHIQLYFQSSIKQDTWKSKDHPNKFLFTFAEVRERFPVLIRNWYVCELRLDSVIAALTEEFSKNLIAQEFRFLNLVHAIETLHRRNRKNEVLPYDEYKLMKEEIINSVDEVYKKWLNEKLMFANERSLHERLEDFVNELPSPICEMLCKPSTVEFIRNIKNTRNYYTHYTETLKKKAFSGRQLHLLSGRLRIMLIVLILKEIGLDEKKIEEIIINKSTFLYNQIITHEDVSNYFRRLEG
ncbi:MAG: hypothetical protein E6Q24_20885 [Chitinophagaceae bacterium]|nr:MAG: hypothetical protein E6Q24_20885 [Chitinophagaceae bacterium]